MATIVNGRNCEGCGLCCMVPAVIELEKPVGRWCPHCSTRKRCDIYADRPQECRDFHCGYLTVAVLGEEWKPSRSKIILTAELDGQRVLALVDPARPDAWRQEPFQGQLRAWAKAAVPHGGQIVVKIGHRAIVVLPDRDVDLGEVGPGDAIITEQRNTPAGPVLNAFKVPLDDPRVPKPA
ncbi:hypothetical protein HDIA_3677 [Hartmannibacter diazotrophicus]|uniref:Flagellin N-methylase n=1 Tax=Hartmannibacter diazotrophicus TaxID=1482074 RepID=A0A2C9DAR0_9HYPH|nr:hypothetical protein [Hartmannibacter diazotrophicus]SON57218.1 hypothetical protein HDIA_3677 [Hartmannibacter diazotrophicus]